MDALLSGFLSIAWGLRRPLFAVGTSIFALVEWLNWVDSTHSGMAAAKASLWVKSRRWIRAFLAVPVRASCNQHT